MSAENPHHQALATAITRIRASIEKKPCDLPAAGDGTAALDVLSANFNLTPFERDLLVLAAAAEVDGPTAALLVAAGADPRRPAMTFSLALEWLDEPHWSAFSPSAPLRRWRLLDVNPGDSLMHGPARIDERVLHFLMGVAATDDRIHPLFQLLPEASRLAPVQEVAAAQAISVLAQGSSPLVQLCGGAGETRLVAAAVGQAAGLRPAVMIAANVPASPGEREAVARLIEREMVFSSLLPVLDLHAADAAEIARGQHLAACLESRALLLTAEPVSTDRAAAICEVPRASGIEQQALWREAIGENAATLNGGLERVVRQFDFDAAGIARTAARFSALPADPDVLWKLCQEAARPRMESLAQRIICRSAWDDLVLPEAQKSLLRELATQAANRHTVHEEWGFAARGPRGLGLTSLFAGPSGTGKTLAAEVLAAELKLDLYRIDLSATVSKWLGETEKNLARIFEAAEAGGAILLFDEADATTATLRWTGSWHTIFLTIDRTGGLAVDAAFEEEIRDFLEPWRMAGHDLEIDAPSFVSLEITLSVCVKPGYFRSDVKRALMTVFDVRRHPDGTRGFFHPDNFTFGDPVHLSAVLAAAQSVDGVQHVEASIFRRQGETTTAVPDKLTTERLEIPRLENHPAFADHGIIGFDMKGGR